MAVGILPAITCEESFLIQTGVEKLTKTWDPSAYIHHYRKGSLSLPYPPLNVRIEPTNKCNLRCVMCPNGVGGDDKQKLGFMNFEIYKKIVAEAAAFPHLAFIALYLGGEPLLHKDLVKMITLAKDEGLLVGCVTNATLLTEKMADAILQSGLDHITLSFDDVSPEEYEAMRRNAKYDKTLKNIIAFLKRKKELGMKYPSVDISSLRLRDYNSDQEQKLEPSSKFCELFSDFDVKINCEWAHLWAGDFDQNPLYNYKRTAPSVYPVCNMPWRDITINWEGNVVGCCYDLKYDYIVGDVTEKTLLELWNSERMMELRKVAATGDYKSIKLCRSCSFVLENVERNL